MATNLTFTSLVADLQNYIERGGSALSDPTVFAQLPRLINLAERKLANALKLQGQIEVLVDAPAGLQAGNPIVSKPDRWRATISVNYGSGPSQNSRTFLYPRSYEYACSYWPDRSQTDPNFPPAFYADVDINHWLISPTPDQNYPLEILAYFLPPLLDNSNQENFWTELCPALLLYGSLLEAEPFLKDDARVQTWGTMYQQEIATLSAQDLQRQMDRAAQRKAA